MMFRMPTSMRLVAGAAVVVALTVWSGVAAAQAPPVPQVPQVPMPQIPGAQTERFRLVLEGETLAIRDLDLGATVGNCTSTVNAHIVEKGTWRRGRGVTIEFTRLGTGRRAPVLMRRVGSALPVFTVNVEATRRSSGAASRTGPAECLPVTEDLTTGPDCGVPERTDAKISLTYIGGLLKVRKTGLGNVGDIRCPVSNVYGGTPELAYGWPTPVKVRDEPLPAALIFGKRRAFVVRTSAPRRRTNEPLVSGPLSGSVTDIGENRLTIRFIRL